ncbi:MAG: thiamine diphosphokinase, partial [Lachnospiraceae bacterium]|nr:thiamine diphosphokinase [Lachnospiraceae bacterium]
MSNHNICIIVGASVVVAEDFLFFVKKWRAQDRELLLIAADAGYQLFEDPKIAQLIQPDLVVGDFDSLGSVPSHPHIIRHPAVKDDTDLMLAVREGLSQGYRQFAVFGGLGNRFDHSFANMQLLSFLQSRGARGILFGDPMHMTTIRQGELVFSEEFAGVISVFALSQEASGVNVQGLFYELAD